jgi:queuine tRNA-ribosyltransferase
MLGARLNTIHNLTYYQALMRELRAAVAQRRLADFSLGADVLTPREG